MSTSACSPLWKDNRTRQCCSNSQNSVHAALLRGHHQPLTARQGHAVSFDCDTPPMIVQVARGSTPLSSPTPPKRHESIRVCIWRRPPRRATAGHSSFRQCHASDLTLLNIRSPRNALLLEQSRAAKLSVIAASPYWRYSSGAVRQF